MSWLADFVKPKIQALMKKSSLPENLWTKCSKCEHLLFTKELEDNLNVCHYCGNHMRIDIALRLRSLYDNALYEEFPISKVVQDPLKFKDSKKYTDRLKEAKSKTHREDSVIATFGHINNVPAVIAGFDFNFMGGSLGIAAGEALVIASQKAIEKKCGLIIISASGGARMQEGVLSLMQMPRSIIAVEKVKEAGLPYISVLTDPTTGGVLASFSMLGDIAIAEPNSLIGFTGARVIEETIRQKLPEGFQRAEYLLDHGMIDIITHRSEMKKILSQLLQHCYNGIR
ncbi:MAG: acetyl-CoA carboxylase carboxyl transferase subunit beta [Candidatus Puniceispirillum sp.]|nr:acetyl-CoA carboxylase carboxyl transferase subunit beta [Candidatus Pelagibacter sp.]MBA4283061.1 acetyl-CoA carboxylase carboxyl transferase subunit beta [Candidatus Puniceispirillum sp.]